MSTAAKLSTDRLEHRASSQQAPLDAALRLTPANEADRPAAYRIVLGLFLALLALIFLLPLIQYSLTPLPKKQLAGVPMYSPKPKLSLASLLNESFQKAAEPWAMKKSGLWGWLVRLDNQINFSLFRQVSAGYGSSVHLGQDGHLFQAMYLGAFNRKAVFDPAMLEQRVVRLKTLQEILAKHDIALILLISTNVLALHPDIAPPSFTDPARLSRKNSYQIIRPLLDKHQLNYIDTHEYLEELKPKYPFRFFEPTGSHWNDVAACLIAEKLIGRIEENVGRRMTHLNCGTPEMRYPPKQHDLDLVRIANLLFGRSTFRPAPYPQITAVREGEVYRPRVLFVGTSFVFSLLRLFEHYQVFHWNNLFFYYRKVRYNLTGYFGKLERDKIKWENSLENHAIIFEINQAMLEHIGFRYLDDAIEHFSKLEPRKRQIP